MPVINAPQKVFGHHKVAMKSKLVFEQQFNIMKLLSKNCSLIRSGYSAPVSFGRQKRPKNKVRWAQLSLVFQYSFSMEQLLQTYLAAFALQAENKAHIIHAAQDKMERRGHYEGGSAQVHLCMQRTGHGVCVLGFSSVSLLFSSNYPFFYIHTVFL